MAITATTLNGAITATDSLINLTSGTSVVAGVLLRVDSEMMRVQAAGPSSTTFFVERGINGTAAVAHNTLAIAHHGPASDFPADGRNMPLVVTYGAAGAVAIPSKDAVILLNSGAASAMTIADPGLADEGRRLDIRACTAHAYTLSNAAGSGFNAGGAAADVGTFGGAIGDGLEIRARNGKWIVEYLRNVTLA